MKRQSPRGKRSEGADTRVGASDGSDSEPSLARYRLVLTGHQQVLIVVGLPEQLGRPTDGRRRLKAARREIVDDITHTGEVIRQLAAEHLGRGLGSDRAAALSRGLHELHGYQTAD